MDNLYSKHINPEYASSAAKAFKNLFNIIRTLRAPDGCPWDLEQSPLSLRKNFLEEAYEVVEAIDKHDSEHTCEELGDLLLIVLLVAYIEEQNGSFLVEDVINSLSEKLVRRHPHVFANSKAGNAQEVSSLWEKIKTDVEHRKPKTELQRHLPPLAQAYEIQKAASKKGFDWEAYTGPLNKIYEEIQEIKELIPQQIDKNNSAHEELEMELGDLFFSVINLCRKLKVYPINALNRSTHKFISRFAYIQEEMEKTKQEMNSSTRDLMEALWNKSKKR